MSEAPQFYNRIDVQMRFNDIDMFGHVNNSIYMQYFDLGKVQYFSEVLDGLFNFRRESMVIAHIDCDFCHPALAAEPLQVLTRVDNIGESSITLIQQLINPETEEIKCSARVIMVGFDILKAAKMVIPDSWRQRISEYEKREM